MRALAGRLALLLAARFAGEFSSVSQAHGGTASTRYAW